MGILWYSIFTLALALTVGLTLCTLGYRWARQDGYQAGYYQGKADRAQQQLAQRHTARHARTQPRASLTGQQETAFPELPAATPPAALPHSEDNAWYLPPPGPIRSHTSADKISAVQLPGPSRPQPGRDSGPGTLTMARIALPATTGEMAAITDEYIERMQLEEAEHRRTLTA